MVCKDSHGAPHLFHGVLVQQVYHKHKLSILHYVRLVLHGFRKIISLNHHPLNRHQDIHQYQEILYILQKMVM
jgi:hypothetical protein